MTSIQVERARQDEREALIDLFNAAFRHDNPSHIDFRQLMPDLYRPCNFRGEDHLVIRDHGRPVAGLALLPLQFAVGPNVMDVAGIGQVSTHPNYRARGFMTALMKAAEAEIDRGDYVLGYLGGDRARYARFGFEATIYLWQFQLAAKDLADVDLGAWTFSEPAEFEPWMNGAIEAKPFRRKMTFDVMKWAVRRAGNRLLATNGPADRAIVVYNMDGDPEGGDGPERRGNATVQDWGGPVEGILALVVELARTSDGGTVHVTTPAFPDDLHRLLHQHASRCIPHTTSNLRITQLEPLLRTYLPWLSRAVNACPDGLTLRITGTDQQATLMLADQAKLVARPSHVEIAMNRLDMATLLFGPFPPSRLFDLPPQLHVLDAVLPLPIFFSGISWV